MSVERTQAPVANVTTVPARVVEVAVCCPLRQTFEYAGSEQSSLAPGDLVWVPFGPRKLCAVVLALHASSEHQLKPIDSTLSALRLDAQLLQLLQWCWRYYQHPPGDILQAALPTALRQHSAALRLLGAQQIQHYALSAAGREQSAASFAGKPAQLALWQLLQQAPRTRDQLQQALPGWRRSWRLLQAAGLVEQITLASDMTPVAAAFPSAAWQPNSEQRQALQAICGDREGVRRSYRCVLLDGVTGSGKTLVYIEAMRRLLQQGGQALLLVPEIGLVQQLREQLQQHLGTAVAVFHSGRSDQQRARCWLQVKQGRVQIVVGTRSSVFLPFADLRLIVVDEEHDHAYKQFEGFPYHARDVAIKRAFDLDIPVVLGSATAALETLFNVDRQRFERVRLQQRFGNAAEPEWRLLDLREQPDNSDGDGLLHQQAVQAVRSALTQQQQVLVFLNRRGYAPLLQCPACGWSADCAHCAVEDRHMHMNWHRGQRKLLCHHCGQERPQPRHCPACGEPDISAIGAGTEKLEELLQRQFAPYPVHRIDSDNMTRRDAMRDLRQLVLGGEPCILAGTQMISKGHHFPGISLVVVQDADQALFSADYRATEKLAQQLVQVAGRCGRGRQRGRILLQTHQPEHPLLKSLINKGYHAVAADLLSQRQAMQLPPWQHQAVIRVDAPDLRAVQAFMQQACACARRLHPVQQRQVQLLGPIPALLERKAGRYRHQLWLQCEQRGLLHSSLSQLLAALDQLKTPRNLRWRPDVDPLEM